jgi:hypothetical protein
MKYFINLSAGLYQRKYTGEIIRIQSSHIESKAYDRLFLMFPDSILYNLAAGEDCCIVDCTSNKVGKVINRIPLFNYIIKRSWYNTLETKGLDKKYVDWIYRNLSSCTKAKIRYFKKFMKGSPGILTGISIKLEKEKDDT